MWWIDPQHETQLYILGAGALLLLVHLAVPFFRTAGVEDAGPLYRRAWPEKTLLALMAVVGIAGIGAYTRFLDFQGPRQEQIHTFHDHDIYHYAIGAKYYPELGHERLYECTWLAFAELRSAGVESPKVPRLRSLSDPDRFFIALRERDRIEDACHGAFQEDRWVEFKRDLRAWFKTPLPDRAWQVALVDLGYNPPPTYNLFAHNLASVKELRAATLQLFPFIDMTLLFAVGGAFVWWAFGPWAAFAYFTIIGTNWIASYRWTGGSFCRQLWMAFLVYAVCCLKKEHYAWGGIFLALCASMRVFPLVFVVGGVVAMAGLAYRDPARRRDLGVVVGAGLATAVGLFLASVAQFGMGAWQEFFDKMSHHGTSWFMWHIGFKKWAVFYPEIAENSGVRVARGWWWAKPATFQATFDAGWFWLQPLRLAMSLGALAVAWRRPAFESTLVFGGVVLFCWSMPANYYYVYLALLPAAFYSRSGDLFAIARTALTFLTMASLSYSPWVHKEPFVQNGWMNRTIFWFFMALLVSYAVEEGLAWRARRAEGTGPTGSADASDEPAPSAESVGAAG